MGEPLCHGSDARAHRVVAFVALGCTDERRRAILRAMRVRVIAAVVVVVVVAVGASLVHAAEPTAPAPAPLTTSTSPPPPLVGAAVQASENAQYCDALHYFLALNERWPSERALYNAAEVAYAAGDRVRALDLYREAQRLYPEFEKRDAVQKRADEVFQAMVRAGPGTACAVRELSCGDWRVTANEQCDDGNGADGDGCDSNCRVTGCGNGQLTAGEQCDDGNGADGDGCDRGCVATGCGNGAVTAGEQCDDGNRVDGDGCDHDCTATVCGNGLRTSGEQCDDGNGVDGDGCDRGCVVSACGNGVRAGREQCDDGNVVDGDGCESTCTITRRPAPLMGTLVASGGVAGVVGGALLIALGAQLRGAHDAAVDAVEASDAAYAADPDGAVDAAIAAREREARARDEWQSGGVISLGTGVALTVASLAVGSFGVWSALTATEEVAPPAREEGAQ